MKIKTITFTFFSLCSILKFSAQTQGPNNPSEVTNSDLMCLQCPGTIWSNPANIETADQNYATALLYKADTACSQKLGCYFSRSLVATGFSFTIPSNATILGIQVNVIRSYTNPLPSIEDTIVELTKNKFTQSNNLASSKLWSNANPTKPTTAVYGNASDLSIWGLSWTPADIDSSTFGVYFAAKNTSTSKTTTAEVDNISITVTYSTPTGIESQTRSIQNFSVYTNRTANSLDLSFGLATSSITSISVYNMVGQLQFSKELGFLPEGRYNESLPISQLVSGIYLLRLSSGNEENVRKIMIF